MSSISVHEHKVIDNKDITMADALVQLLPLGRRFCMAVGYFYLGGYELVKEQFNAIASQEPIKVIMGNRTDYRTAHTIREGMELQKEEENATCCTINPVTAIRLEIEAVPADSPESHTAYNLRDLVASGRLKIKVYTGPADYFHAKVYLIGREEIPDGYAIVGSSNFSCGGFTGNSELNVLTKDSFPNLWTWFNGLWASDAVQDFSLELLEIIDSNVTRPTDYTPIFQEKRNATNFTIPPFIEVREYQKEAIKAWFRHNGQGILEMATGTGKTITSLVAAAKVYEHHKKLALVVVCPYKHLVVQWQRECKTFGLDPVLGYESAKTWQDELNAKITSFNIGALSSFCVITTNNTFASENMQASLAKLKSHAMIIADECHHLGASDLRSKLPENFIYRLGLSATPDRWYDDEGSLALKGYFTNGVIFTFSLKDAIGRFLTEYYYFPHVVVLTEDENQEYLELSIKISKLNAISGDIEMASNPSLKRLLLKRARLISKAENKLSLLKDLLRDQTGTSHNLFYCGSSKENGERQVEKVVNILGNDLRMKVHPFTSLENRNQRKELLAKFETGELQGLVAIKCLDEGVDVPATKTAYILASSTNPREFVQRRGRLLRRSPGKRFAYIHDFIVIPSHVSEIKELPDGVFSCERLLVKKELARFKEFSELAINSQQARGVILEVADRYNLLDF